MPVSEEYKRLRDEYNQKVERSSSNGKSYTTLSGEPVNGFYGPDDLEKIDYLNDLNFPGEYPYTRGIHANGYRGKVWTMRQFAGFGSPEDTNQRFHYLLKNGQTGLSVAFDLPTLMGWDADAELAQGEVGLCGVSISSLKDMETLLDRIPLDQVSTSMTINSPAAIVFAFYLAVAKKQ
ncbi:MAG: methylmalonyl-CoA mutase family protein, partial [Ignavibacteriaceae bacterium]|nr:methylmalonyl-CoA mutase family protein [Ignavibacteriaceae bacterium]